jgi:rRNA biogenesis protein RRP5
VPSLSSTLGPYKPGTLHRARVIGHSPLDGVVLLSFEQKVLDQIFMTVNELHVGQHLRGTVHRLSDKAMFVNINGSVHGVVWPNHYADIQLKHPEKRFKVGGTVKARVFELDVPRSRVVLTLKRSLVDSDLEIPQTMQDVKRGQIVPAVVSKLLDKGCIVDLFGGMRAFVPQSEAR